MTDGQVFTIRVTDDRVDDFDNLENGEKYVLYINVDGAYYALDSEGNTVQVPDNNLDTLPSNYLWRFTSLENGSTYYDNASSWLNGGNYLDVYNTDKDKPIVKTGNWLPVVSLVPVMGGGFVFRDLNPDTVTPLRRQNRYLVDEHNYDDDSHNIRTRFGDVYWAYDGDSYSNAVVVYVYKQGSSYTVTATSNNNEYGKVQYTHDGETYQTSASQTTFSIQTENSVTLNKSVPDNFVAVPEQGYKFTGWTVSQVNAWDAYEVTNWGAGATSASTTIKPTVNGDLILQANFEPEKLYTFTVQTNDETMGTVGGGNTNGDIVTGQVNFESISRVVINGAGKNAYELTATKKPLYKFVEWRLTNSGGETLQTITTSKIDARSLDITRDGMMLTAVFAKKSDTEISEEDIDTLLNSWKADMVSDFVGVDKTAHVHDYENRIYEIDLCASSGKWAVDRSIALDFITDTSRSMFFPANLDYAINANPTEEANRNASTFTNLRSWLNDYGDTNEKYYVVTKYTSSDTTATMCAVYYEGGQWKFVDSSYYYNTDGQRRGSDKISQVPTKNKPGKNEDGYAVLSGKELSGIIYKSSTAPASYREGSEPAVLTEYWSRLDYLYKAVMTATYTLKSIDKNAKVHVTTFNKASTNKGYLSGSEQQIYNTLKEIDPDGGTRQDEGLYTSRTGENCTAVISSKGDGPGSTEEVGSTSPFYDSSKKHFAILITDGAPNGTNWTDIGTQATKLKAIEDSAGNKLTLMTLGVGLNFVGNENKQGLTDIATSADYAEEANNGGQIVKAIKDLVQSMVKKADMYGTVSDTLDPAFYPVKSDGTPIMPGFYTMGGDSYTPTTNDTNAYCQWTRNGEAWTVTYYNQSFKWPQRDDNGNIITNGWERAFYAKAKENFLGGNTIETNSVGSTAFTATHTVLLDDAGTELPSTKTEIKDIEGHADPIVKNDIPTPHVNVKQLTLTENKTAWKVYVETRVDPLPQIKELYNNIKVLEVVEKSKDNMITSNEAMLFTPGQGTKPESFLLKDVIGEIDWSKLTGEPGYVDVPYTKYDHATGVIRIALTKDGEKADYSDYATSSNLADVEEYVLTAQFIPYTVDEMLSKHGDTTTTHDKLYHTTSSESPGAVQQDGKPSVNTHTIELFVRGLSLTKANESFEKGLSGAEFKVYRPATAEEIAAGGDAIKTFEGDTGKYVWDRDLNPDSSGVVFVNGVASRTPPSTKYYVVETKAPDGYTLREKPIPVVLEISDSYTPIGSSDSQSTKPTSGLYNWEEKASLTIPTVPGDTGIIRTTGAYDPTNEDTVLTHTAVIPSSEYEVMYYRIANNPGVALPNTGGPGAAPFAIPGALLALCGAGLLLRKRKCA